MNTLHFDKKYKTVICYFGGAKNLATLLKIKTAAVYRWKTRKRIPKWQAYQIQLVSNSHFTVEELADI